MVEQADTRGLGPRPERGEGSTPSARTAVIDLALWTLVALGALAGTSQCSDTPRLAPIQALTPWLMAPSVPAGLLAALTGRWPQVLVAALVVGFLVRLSPPLRRTATPPAHGPVLRVLYANVKFDQATPQLAAETLMRLAVEYDVDVLSASEVTVTLAEALEANGIHESLPSRVGTPVTGPEASVIWTRRTVIERGDRGPGPTWDAEVTIDVDGAPLRVIATHPLPPVGADMRPHWQPGLASTAQRARRTGAPTLVVGDLNAAHWHPSWRRFVGRSFASAHETLGRGWTMSWPDDRWWPPFVRLDHALCGPGLAPLSIQDVSIPGSDHRGFVVSVATTDLTARPR